MPYYTIYIIEHAANAMHQLSDCDAPCIVNNKNFIIIYNIYFAQCMAVMLCTFFVFLFSPRGFLIMTLYLCSV